MQDRVGGDGEGREWANTDLPAVAKSYYLSYISLKSANAGQRNLSEMTTLCSIMDHLALGRYAQAADVVTQRLKAVEMASQDGDWRRASYIELVPEEGASLVSKAEEQVVQKELESKRSLEGSSSYRGNSQKYGKGNDYQANHNHNWVPNKGKKGGKNGNKGKKQGKGNVVEEHEA